MARKTKVVVVCDRHRGDVEAVASVEISVEGDRRRIDLCADHLAELRKALKPFLGTATTRKRAASARPSGRRSSAADVAAVRGWARENGYEVSERGRIPNAVREAYAAAH